MLNKFEKRKTAGIVEIHSQHIGWVCFKGLHSYVMLAVFVSISGAKQTRFQGCLF